MLRLPHVASAKGRRLLRLLLVRFGRVPAHSAVPGLLWWRFHCEAIAMNRVSKAPVAAGPSVAKRVFYFVLGTLIGGTIGYGFVTAGPGPAPSLLEPAAALWVFGGAALCGVLGASFPDTFWRRKFEKRHSDDSDER